MKSSNEAKKLVEREIEKQGLKKIIKIVLCRENEKYWVFECMPISWEKGARMGGGDVYLVDKENEQIKKIYFPKDFELVENSKLVEEYNSK